MTWLGLQSLWMDQAVSDEEFLAAAYRMGRHTQAHRMVQELRQGREVPTHESFEEATSTAR